jgi:hypothetical protein
MMDYSKLSDFEINRAVGELTLKGRWSCKPGTAANNTDSWFYGSVDQFVTPYPELPDYCNNPADAWPIIESRFISLQFLQGNWMASVNTSQETGFRAACFIDRANPLRAGMIVFLMMQESE